LGRIRFYDEQGHAARALSRVGLGNDDDEIGNLSIGNEGLRAADSISIPVAARRGANGLQVGTRARLAHGDGANPFAGNELRQPALLLLLGTMQDDIGRDNDIVQAEGEALEILARYDVQQDQVMPKIRTGPAIGFRHRHSQKTCRARLPPKLTLNLARRAPTGNAAGGCGALEKTVRRIGEHLNLGFQHECRRWYIKHFKHITHGTLPP